MPNLSKLPKLIALAVIALSSTAAMAQMQIVRPQKASAPKVAPVSISTASTKVQETNARVRKRNPGRKRVAPVAEAKTVMPPLEFASIEDADISAPLIDMNRYSGEGPESLLPALADPQMRSIAVGDISISLPSYISVFEEGPDFFIGGYDNVIEIDSWMFDSSYKLSDAGAYIKYIERLYGGLESNTSRGDLTEIKGFDSKSNRNYYVALLSRPGKLYVTRIIYKPAAEIPLSEKVFPSLISAAV